MDPRFTKLHELGKIIADYIKAEEGMSRREVDAWVKALLNIESRIGDGVGSFSAGGDGGDGNVWAELTWGKIMRLPEDNSGVEIYEVSNTGLSNALTDARNSGTTNLIWVPPCSLDGDVSVPPNTLVQSMGNRAEFTGQWTLEGPSSSIKGISVLYSASSGSEIVAVESTNTSGQNTINDCYITCTNSGAGDAVGVKQSGVGGELWFWGSYAYGNATGGGDGYGLSQSAGTLYVSDDGRLRGSTAEVTGTVISFSADNMIKLLDGGGGLIQLYPATDAGITSALSDAASGNVVRLPDACSISGTSWTVGSGIELVGTRKSALTGNLTIAGRLHGLAVAGDVTVTTGNVENVSISGSITVGDASNYGGISHSHISGSSGDIITLVQGYVFGCRITVDGAGTQAINATSNNTMLIYNSRIQLDTTTGAGVYLDGASLVVHGLHVYVDELAADIRNAKTIANSVFYSFSNNGANHSTGTANVSACKFITDTGGQYGLNLSAGGMTLTDCHWSSINGEEHVTFGEGDRIPLDDYYTIAANTKTISAGAITADQLFTIVAAETGTADDLDTINYSTEPRFLVLQADTGDTITVKHNTGNVIFESGDDYELSGDDTLLLFYDGTNWAGLSGGGGIGDVSGPASSTDNAIARWDGTGGDTLQDSTVLLDDSGNIDLQGSEVRDYAEQTSVANVSSSPYDIDWSIASVIELTLQTSPTFTFSSLAAGKSLTLVLVQDGTGNRTVTWPGSVDWPNGEPTLRTTGGEFDVITLFVRNDGTTVEGFSATEVIEGYLVKVSSNDTTAGYLNGKLVAGTRITLTEGSDGGDETLTADVTSHFELLQDEDGDPLTDENGEYLYCEVNDA